MFFLKKKKMLENVKSGYVTRTYKLQLGYRECLLPKKKGHRKHVKSWCTIEYVNIVKIRLKTKKKKKMVKWLNKSVTTLNATL